MPKNHEKFHSTNGLRRILIVDDEMVNREILGAMLQDEYELLFACDGAEAIRVMRENKDTLSLVLLDILMPVMSGKEVLKAVREDDAISHIPVIVITSEQDAEVESLKLGAIDFLPKPYPAVDVVKARVLRTIELSEDRDIIQSTERDALTGLYNREYFYRYAEQYDQYHRETPMDAIVLDINHFHMVNERYGKPYGDQVLRRIGEKLREMLSDSGGIVCRRGGDTFMAYCPHREDYQEILYSATAGLAEEGQTNSRVRLRMGVYSYVDKNIDIERRFDRAKMASDTVRGSFTRTIGVYDGALHEKQLFAEQLIEDFPTALAENQFVVFYQPKFDVRPDTPILSGAEALVRWKHPTLGMISPGVFIPLFEENGLIQKLDYYVWRETARQIRSWRENYGFAVPVSVNVSRIDMFDPNLLETLQSLLDEFDIESKYLHLEVTESAYTKNSGQIVDSVERLRSIGFQIEMDDFGTGYSSLNMISSLPIDVLKLDMQFIRSAFQEGGNTKMLEIVIDIADYLSVPVIAEGVETEEQLDALKQLGCDLVQGYFFSKPVPAAEFEPFILQKKEAEKAAEDAARQREAQRESERAELKNIVERISLPQEEPEESEKSEEQEEKEEQKEQEKQEKDAATAQEQQTEKPGIHLRTANLFFVILAFLAAAALLIADLSVTRGYQRMALASDRHIAAQLAAAGMESASDYLTDRVRCFVVTGEIEYLDDFFEEVETARRRDQAVTDLEQLLDGRDSGALAALNTALELSNELVQTEYKAMRLTLEAGDYPMEDIPEEIAGIRLTPEEQSMSREELLKTAQNLVFDNNYMHAKDRIRENVNLCTQALIRSSSQELENASAQMPLLVNIQTWMTVLFLLIVLGIVVIISLQIRKPLSIMVEKMQAQESIPPTGAEELRFVTRTYNAILEENREARERLSHAASHDALTGLFNRGAYDMQMASVDTAHMALLIIDVDHFKKVNDTYGHAVGDRVLKRVAEILQRSFRSVDIICRIGGDEFVVVMTRANSSMRQLVLNKIQWANDLLQHPKDDLPPVSLSVGVAFSDRKNPKGDIFTDADTALYRVKESGRNGCAIF